MSILIILLSILFILGFNGLVFYFLYKKFGKIIINTFKNMPNTYKSPKKYKKLYHFQQELDKINKILEKYNKK